MCHVKLYVNDNLVFSLKDKHLKCYFKKSNTKKQLMVIKQVRVMDVIILRDITATLIR